MSKKDIDLTDIKTNDLDETSSFTDLMSRQQRRQRKNISKYETLPADDIEEMVNEKKKSDNSLEEELLKEKEKFKKIINEPKKEIKETNEVKKTEKAIKNIKETTISNKEDLEESLGKTKVLELTRQMKFNLEENKKENIEKKKKGVSALNIIGEVNLLCIGYYIYLLVFTTYQDDKSNYIITGGIIILLTLFFGLSIVTNKNASKVFNILNIITIIGFILFNAYTLI